MFHGILRGGALLLLIALACPITRAAPPKKGDLVVSVQKLGSEAGVVRWALYSTEGSFAAAVDRDGNAPLKSGTCHPKEHDCRFTISALEHGDYALLLYHDENMNDDLDKRALGLPKERVGVSNYSSRPFRKPYWRKARFTHNQPQTLLPIQTFR